MQKSEMGWELEELEVATSIEVGRDTDSDDEFELT